MTSFRIYLSLAIITAVAALAPAAQALTFNATGSGVQVVESAPENNTLTISRSGSTFTFTDTTVNPTAGTGCTAGATLNTITCASPGASFNAFNMLGTDTVTNTSTAQMFWSASAGTLNFTCGPASTCAITGAEGNDTLTGGPNSDSLSGGDGNDTISGGAGFDSLSGGAGNDNVNGGADADNITCDPGADIVNGGGATASGLGTLGALGGLGVFGLADTYNCASADTPLNISLDGVANDGTSGEGDNITGFQIITGGSSDDTITGSDAPEVLSGGPGNDTLNGQGGADTLLGGLGNDTLNGGAGDDHLDGDVGSDVVDGGPGEDSVSYAARQQNVKVSLDGKANDGELGEADNILATVEDVTGGNGDDVLTGDALANELTGGPGDDKINGAAGSDLVSGGSGSDKLSGGSGRDEILGGSGADTIYSADKDKDEVNCGSGLDRVTFDRQLDHIYFTCELGPRPKKQVAAARL